MSRAGWASIGASVRSSFFLVALATILPCVALIGITIHGEMSREKTRVQQEALSLARALATSMETHLTTRLAAIMGLAQAVSAGAPSPAVAESEARRLRQSFPDLGEVTVTDRFGAVLASTVPFADGRRPVLSDQEWFRRAATAHQVYVGEPRAVDREVVVGLYAAVRTADGRFLGVVAADLGLGEIRKIVERTQVGRTMVAELLTAGVGISTAEPAIRSVPVAWDYAELIRRNGSPDELVFADGERRLAALAPIRSLGWVLAVGLPSAEVFAGARRSLAQLAVGAVVVMVLGLAAAVLASSRESAGMDRLRAAIARLETGSVPANVPVGVGGEVAALTQSFNRALGSLRSKLHEYEAVSQVDEVAGAAITGDRSMSVVLPGLLRKVVGGMAADAGVMVIRENEGLVTRATTGLWGIPTDGVTLRHGEGLAGAVVEGGKPVLVEEVSLDARVEEPYLKASALRSVIAVPIMSGDTVIGVVEVGYRTPRTFSETQVHRLEAMTRRAAQALGHARAIEEVHEEALQAYAGRLEQEVADRTHELRAKTGQLEDKTRQLEQALKLVESSQQKVVEGERLRALGEMASGIAHDFNNALAVMLGRAQLLLRKIEDATVRRHLEVIEKMAIDSGQTVRRIREFTRVQPARPLQPVDLNRLVDEVVEVTRSRWSDQALAKGIRIEVVVEAGPLPEVAGDPSELREALMNLAFNALDAMPNGGRLTFRTGVDAERAYVAVADTGIGMPDDVRRRVFEPFFTTKGERGTGLGLSIVYGIVTRHGGRVEVRSHIGEGSAFTMRLPIGRAVAPAPLPAFAVVVARPGRKILVIDDEQEVRETLVELLADQGHTVQACPDGRSGIAHLKEDAFDLVLTDLGMPGLSGWDVARLAKLQRPDIPVALVTGWGDQIDLGEARAKGVDFVVAKPFEAETITALVAKALAGGIVA